MSSAEEMYDGAESAPSGLRFEGRGGRHAIRTNEMHGGYTARVFVRGVIIHDLDSRIYDPYGSLTIGDGWFDEETETWEECSILRFGSGGPVKLTDDQHGRLSDAAPKAVPSSIEWYDEFASYLGVERAVLDEVSAGLTERGVRLTPSRATYFEPLQNQQS